MKNVKEISNFESQAESILNTNQTVCPNCWGRQEYGGAFFEALKAEKISTINIDQKKGWILAYAEKFLTGIVFQANNKQLVCKNCSTIYIESEN